jgi:polyisoprenoid-binding protein YceI
VYTFLSGLQINNNQYITRQGEISFFSYTTVEDIKAVNNQVLSIVDISKSEIDISMLMSAFVFEKSLMQQHFNESYIESDIYPKATFEGVIQNFDPYFIGTQNRIIKGSLVIHGISNSIEIKARIDHGKTNYIFSGRFVVPIKDYDIKVPTLLAPNIAKTIAISFRFELAPHKI